MLLTLLIWRAGVGDTCLIKIELMDRVYARLSWIDMKMFNGIAELAAKTREICHKWNGADSKEIVL